MNSHLIFDNGQLVNGQLKNDLLTTNILPSEIAVFKIEAFIKQTECEYQGNALAYYHTKTEATESIKIVIHVDEVHSASAKKDPSMPNFCHTDVLVTWQQSAPVSDKLRRVNNGCKCNEQSGLWENQDIWPLGFSQLPGKPHFLVFAFLHPPQCI